MVDYHQTVLSLKDHLAGKNMEELLMGITETGYVFASCESCALAHS
jgi:hypothetical protein